MNDRKRETPASVPALARTAAVRVRSGEDEDEPRDEATRLKLAGFRVGGGAYAIDIMRIKEVIDARPHNVRRVPHAPAIVEGVIQLRGVVIPVVDLRKRFGVAIDPALDRLNKLIIVSVRGRIVGLRVDGIIGELGVSAAAVRPAPSLLRPVGSTGSRGEFFSGVCRRGDEMVFVVNLDALLEVPSRATEEGEV